MTVNQHKSHGKDHLHCNGTHNGHYTYLRVLFNTQISREVGDVSNTGKKAEDYPEFINE